jgi:nicotinamide riboside kinase
MTIISGESRSGKSELAIKLAKKMNNSLYLSLEKDFISLKKMKELGVDFTTMKFKSLLDIKYRILERGGLMFNDLDYVIIDSLNLISDNKSYNEKIEYLLDVEKDFKLKIICTLNKPKLIDIPVDITKVKLIELKGLIK